MRRVRQTQPNTIKLTERGYHTETDSWVRSTAEYYVDGEKLNITEQQLQDYYDADFDSVEWWNVERTLENALWYYYNQEYINFTNNILSATSYPLVPGWPWAAYTFQEHELYSTLSMALIVNQFGEYNFVCASPNIIHPVDPFHLIYCLEMFGHAMCCRNYNFD